MPQTFYNSTTRQVSVLYDVDLIDKPVVDKTQFLIVNSTQNFAIASVRVASNIIFITLSGDLPQSDFGIVYTPGTDFIKATNNTPLGQIYYPVEVSESVCTTNCNDPGDAAIKRLSIENIFCVDENTIEVKFNRYLSTNSIPDFSAFLLLDVPDGGLGNFTQIDVQGKRLFLQHDFNFPLSETSLQYLPPSANFLQTTDNPPLLVLPFISPIACNTDSGTTPCDIQNQIHKNGIGTGYGTRTGTVATIEDYVLIYGQQEALQASNDDNGGATVINRPRLQAELDNAAVMLNNYINIATWSGKALLAGSFQRTQLVIARYYLLNKSRPEVVREEFERTLSWIETSSYSNGNKYQADCPEGQLGSGNGGFSGISDTYYSGGRVMTYSSTQQYRVEDGLGLRGWHLPLYNGEDHLWKTQNGYYVPDYHKRRFIRGV